MRPDAPSSDFLIPWSDDAQPVFLGLKTGKKHTYGLMIYLGRSICENDLFAKVVDLGMSIESVDNMIRRLCSYLEQLQTLRIGNVARITSANDGKEFKLELVSATPSSFGER
jgi:hypothetical protein